MTLWVSFVLLLLAALAFVVWPLYRGTNRSGALLPVTIVVVVALSAGLYYHTGNPGARSLARTTPDANEMVASALQLLEAEGGAISNHAAGLLENALVLDPNHPQALFYGGFAAANRGDTALAADRWERLMGLNAPPEIRSILQEKIDEWRGVTAPAVENFAAIVIASVSVSAEAQAALPDEAAVFVIARDPQQPSPPIAVARRRLSELPVTVELSDRESMVPGRLLSAFPQFELLVRVSVSGGPIARSGDWFGATLFSVGTNNEVTLVVDQEVP